jgi:hypothetical protein
MARDYAIRNPQQLLKNMVAMRDILAKHDITCWLHNGTCLGAIREKGFIPHDDDADLGIYAKDYEKFLGLIPEIEAAGFERVPEHDWKGRLIQFRNKDEKGMGEQVDVFWEKPVKFLFWKRWDLGGRVTVAWKYLSTLDTINFLGEDFLIPHNAAGLMRNLYGKTWRTPLKNVRTKKGIKFELEKILENPGKLFFYEVRFLKNRVRIVKEMCHYRFKIDGWLWFVKRAIKMLLASCIVVGFILLITKDPDPRYESMLLRSR